MTTRYLLPPTLVTGALMATYLLIRPYGDQEGQLATAEALASNAWIAAHVCGLLALASFGGLALRLNDLTRSRPARVARTTGLAGVTLVLPYYGAESFGLHAIGRESLRGDLSALRLVDQVRDQPVAATMFGLGLVLLAVSGVCVAVAWQRSGLVSGWMAGAAWPLGLAVALVLPQFYLPVAGRIGFGVAYAAAAVVLAAAAWSAGAVRTAAPSTDGPAIQVR